MGNSIFLFTIPQIEDTIRATLKEYDYDPTEIDIYALYKTDMGGYAQFSFRADDSDIVRYGNVTYHQIENHLNQRPKGTLGTDI